MQVCSIIVCYYVFLALSWRLHQILMRLLDQVLFMEHAIFENERATDALGAFKAAPTPSKT